MSQNIQKISVTCLSSLFDVENPVLCNLDDVLLRIKNQEVEPTVKAVRAAVMQGDKAYVTRLKRNNLPACVFHAHFNGYVDGDSLCYFTGLMVYDLDKLPQDTVAMIMESVRTEQPCAYFGFITPSGNGVKVGIRMNDRNRDELNAMLGVADKKAIEERYKSIYRSFYPWFGYLGCEEKIDASSEDLARRQLLSSDDAIYINPNCTELDYVDEPDDVPDVAVLEKAAVAYYDNRIREYKVYADQQFNPIVTFNEQFGNESDVRRLLTDAGYTLVKGNRYLKPNGSGNAGVLVFQSNRGDWLVYSHHANDPYFADRRAHDAFDIYRLTRCGGDLPKALNWNPEGTKLNQREYAQRNSLCSVNSSNGDAVRPVAVVDSPVALDVDYVNLPIVRCFTYTSAIFALAGELAKAQQMPLATSFFAIISTNSGMLARQFCVERKNGSIIPIGLYTLLEQPSASGKSRFVNFVRDFYVDEYKAKEAEYQQQLIKARPELIRVRRSKLSTEQEIAEAERRVEAYEQLQITAKKVSLDNTTPEAAEASLAYTAGCLWLADDEQTMTDNMLGLSYGKEGKANNFSVLLKGFDGGTLNSARVSRDAYSGTVCTSVTGFAQRETIDKMLRAGSHLGVAERFTFIAEQHNLGKRQWDDEYIVPSSAVAFFKTIATSIVKSVFARHWQYWEAYIVGCKLKLKPDFTTHTRLRASDNAYKAINDLKNELEQHLADGEKFSEGSLRGSAGKADMKVLKLAANLYLCDYYDSWKQAICEDGSVEFGAPLIIPDECVMTAINLVRMTLHAEVTLLTGRGAVGEQMQQECVLSYFANVKQSQGIKRYLAINQIVQRAAFKNLPQKSVEAGKVIDALIEAKQLELNGTLIRLSTK